MARHPVHISLLLPLALALAACSSSDGGSTSTNFLEACTGQYLCVIEGETVSGSLNKSAGVCSLGGVELRSNGTSAPIDGQSVTWSGDANRIEICPGSVCFACYADGPTTSAPSASKRECTGSATSCSSVGASSCSSQRGCYYTVGINTSSTSDDGCAGSADSCDEFSTEDRCESQRGCSWR